MTETDAGAAGSAAPLDPFVCHRKNVVSATVTGMASWRGRGEPMTLARDHASDPPPWIYCDVR
jgi:hypothetical protein